MKINPNKICKLSAFLIFLASTNSYAITLDAFNFSTRGRFNAGNIGQTVSTVQNVGGAYGGTRSIELTRTSGGTGLDASHAPVVSNFPSPSHLSFNAGYGDSGRMLLTYDGNNQAGLNNYSGLGSLDLTQDGADALNFDIWYDFPANRSMNLVFTFYDASDPTGNKWSRGIYNVDRRYDNNAFTTLALAFTSLNQYGSNGAANLKNIGAFSLLFDGTNNYAADIGIANLRTNGSPNVGNPVPEPATIGLLISGIFGGIVRKRRKV